MILKNDSFAKLLVITFLLLGIISCGGDNPNHQGQTDLSGQDDVPPTPNPDQPQPTPIPEDLVNLCLDNLELDPGEECVYALDTRGCRADCKWHTCGDGVVAPYEFCDDGQENGTYLPLNKIGEALPYCNLDCDGYASYCGDGTLDSDIEECDDNNQKNNDGCSRFCQKEFCGDGVRQASEACDPGDQDYCSEECTLPECGDGDDTDPGEACDDGNNENGDGCSSLCQVEACGDDVKQASEFCDDGELNGSYGYCAKGCQQLGPRCGDGSIQIKEGEACDDGADKNGLAGYCYAQCQGWCGDGVINCGLEECDDANLNEEDECSNQCRRINGGLDWYLQLGSEGYEYIQKVHRLKNGNILIYGFFTGAEFRIKNQRLINDQPEISNSFIGVVTPQGQLLWTAQLKGKVHPFGIPPVWINAFTELSNGNLIFSGQFYQDVNIFINSEMKASLSASDDLEDYWQIPTPENVEWSFMNHFNQSLFAFSPSGKLLWSQGLLTNFDAQAIAQLSPEAMLTAADQNTGFKIRPSLRALSNGELLVFGEVSENSIVSQYSLAGTPFISGDQNATSSYLLIIDKTGAVKSSQFLKVGSLDESSTILEAKEMPNGEIFLLGSVNSSSGMSIGDTQIITEDSFDHYLAIFKNDTQMSLKWVEQMDCTGVTHPQFITLSNGDIAVYSRYSNDINLVNLNQEILELPGLDNHYIIILKNGEPVSLKSLEIIKSSNQADLSFSELPSGELLLTGKYLSGFLQIGNNNSINSMGGFSDGFAAVLVNTPDTPEQKWILQIHDNQNGSIQNTLVSAYQNNQLFLSTGYQQQLFIGSFLEDPLMNQDGIPDINLSIVNNGLSPSLEWSQVIETMGSFLGNYDSRIIHDGSIVFFDYGFTPGAQIKIGTEYYQGSPDTNRSLILVLDPEQEQAVRWSKILDTAVMEVLDMKDGGFIAVSEFYNPYITLDNKMLIPNGNEDILLIRMGL